MDNEEMGDQSVSKTNALISSGDCRSNPVGKSPSVPFTPDKLEHLAPSDIHAPNRSLRHISNVALRKIARHQNEFGQILPLIVDAKCRLVHGDAALAAALENGLDKVSVVRVEHLNEEQIRLLRIALNKLPELEEWDPEALAIELKDLLEFDVDIELSGFEVPEIDALTQSELSSDLDRVPEVRASADVVVEAGDIWLCGPHTVICGDARDIRTLQRFLGANSVRMVLTDPPYNIPIRGFVSGLGSKVHDEFVMGSSEMSQDEFFEFLNAFLAASSAVLMDGGLIYSFMDWRGLDILTAAGKALGLSHLNTCVWKKTNGGMGGLYRSAHEMVAIFKKGKASHLNNIQLGKYGRNRTNVWEYEGCNSINPERRKELADHPTPKPVPLLIDAILDVTNPKDIVLDPFLGSGSALIAANEAGRVAVGVELDPKYVDVTLRRWITHTGDEPVHIESGLTYAQMVGHRHSSEASSTNQDTTSAAEKAVV